MDHVQFIMDFEDGLLTPEEEYKGFQELISSGLLWELQGNYGRHAKKLGLVN